MNKEQLYRFFEGYSTEEEMREIKIWMEASAENERSFLKERKIYDSILMLGDVKGERQKTAVFIGSRKLLMTLFKVAAIAVLTLALNSVYHHFLSGTGDAATQSITVPSGQRVSLQLPDGTSVWLNARTTLTYPVNFNKKRRVLELDGEAYFEVAPDVRRPFIVQTKSGEVEALGTSFNLESYSASDEFEVTLMEGKVKVSLEEQNAQSVILLPDKKAYLQGGVLLVEHVSDYTPYRWREGLICFKHAPFAAVMKELEKYYGVEIRIKNEGVLPYRYTGKFRHTDGVDYALRVLQHDIAFLTQWDEEGHIIYIE